MRMHSKEQLAQGKSNIERAISFLKTVIVPDFDFSSEVFSFHSTEEIFEEAKKAQLLKETNEVAVSFEIVINAFSIICDNFKPTDFQDYKTGVGNLGTLSYPGSDQDDIYEDVIFLLAVNLFNWDIATNLVKIGQHDFWEFIIKVSNTLNLLEINHFEFLKGLETHQENIQGNYGIHSLYQSYQGWAGEESASAKILLSEILKDQSHLRLTFVPPLIRGVAVASGNEAAFLFIKYWLDPFAPLQSEYVLLGLSTLRYSGSDDHDMKIALFILEHLRGDSSGNEVLSCQVHLNLFVFCKAAREGLKALAGSISNPQCAYLIFSAIWREKLYDNYGKLISEIILDMPPVNPENMGIMRIVNYLLFDLIANTPKLVNSLIHNWLTSDKWTADDIVKFKDFFERASINHSDFVDNWIFETLQKREMKLHLGLMRLAWQNNFSPSYKPSFPLERLELCNDQNLEWLIRKTLGFILDKELLRPLIISILLKKNLSQNMKKFIKDIFLEYIFYNYPSTKEWLNDLERTAKSQSFKRFVKDLQEQSDLYFDRIYEAPILEELKGSEVRHGIYHKWLSHQTQKQMEETRNSSETFMSMIPAINLKGGKRWFSKVDGRYSEKRALTQFQHSGELPRAEFIDPLGQERLRIFNRMFGHEAYY